MDAVPVKFKGTLSQCFDPYMDIYVAEEDKCELISCCINCTRNLTAFFSRFIEEEKWCFPEDADQKVTKTHFYITSVGSSEQH